MGVCLGYVVLLVSEPPALPTGEGVGGREGWCHETEGGSLAAPALVFQPPKAAICSAADLLLVLLLAATGAS